MAFCDGAVCFRDDDSPLLPNSGSSTCPGAMSGEVMVSFASQKHGDEQEAGIWIESPANRDRRECLVPDGSRRERYWLVRKDHHPLNFAHP